MPESEDNENKLKSLDKRISEYKRKYLNKSANLIKYLGGDATPIGISMELFAGGIVGVIIGLVLDHLFEMKPFFLVLCIILGEGAALKNIYDNLNKR